MVENIVVVKIGKSYLKIGFFNMYCKVDSVLHATRFNTPQEAKEMVCRKAFVKYGFEPDDAYISVMQLSIKEVGNYPVDNEYKVHPLQVDV